MTWTVDMLAVVQFLMMRAPESKRLIRLEAYLMDRATR